MNYELKIANFRANLFGYFKKKYYLCTLFKLKKQKITQIIYKIKSIASNYDSVFNQ
jgi:hypothetical protein